MKNETIMHILNNEYDKEMECAFKCKDLMNKTYNPFKWMQLYLSRKMFLQHCIGIDLVKRQLLKAMEKES